MPQRVLVTGASGVLGSAVFAAFRSAGHTVVGTCHTRARADLVQVDLTDPQKTRECVAAFKPNWIVHCAAERRPDVAEKNPEGAMRLNAEVPRQLAVLAVEHASVLVYISTDYVFDGTDPPYRPDSTPNPLQLYGRTKLAGERTVLEDPANPQIVVLRVPILYGPAPNNADSAVNILVDIVRDQSGKVYTMDHHAQRRPTNVLDIASFLVRLCDMQRSAPLPRIMHYSAPEVFTKYDMCLVFARILGLPHAHIRPDATPPAAATARPRDCHLDTTATEELGVPGGLGCCAFEHWWAGHLATGDEE